MTGTIAHRQNGNMTSFPAVVLNTALIAVAALIAVLAVVAMRSNDASPADFEPSQAPAAYVPTAADWFEQRAAGLAVGGATQVPSAADLFEQRVPG